MKTLLSAFALLALCACASLGLTPAQDPQQRLVYAVGIAASAEAIGDQLLTSTPPAIGSQKAAAIQLAASTTNAAAMAYLNPASCVPNPSASPPIICPMPLVSALAAVNAQLPMLEAFVQQYSTKK